MSAAGDMLARAVKNSGMSQAAVARTAGVDSSNITKMCRGQQNIPVIVAVKLEKALDLTAESLLVTQLYDQIRDYREDLLDESFEARSHRRWTEEEDSYLIEHVGATHVEIARHLDRTPAAVAGRYRTLRLAIR